MAGVTDSKISNQPVTFESNRNRSVRIESRSLAGPYISCLYVNSCSLFQRNNVIILSDCSNFTVKWIWQDCVVRLISYMALSYQSSCLNSNYIGHISKVCYVQVGCWVGWQFNQLLGPTQPVHPFVGSHIEYCQWLFLLLGKKWHVLQHSSCCFALSSTVIMPNRVNSPQSWA